MDFESSALETPSEFLKNLEEAISKQPEMDTDLNAIIFKNILKVEPDVNCVEDAITEILKLVEERAIKPKLEKPNA